MKLEVHIHVHNDTEIEILRSLSASVQRIEERVTETGVKVMESPEVTAFRETVSAGLDNIAADIQRLLDRPNTLSQEDKDALAAIAQRVTDVASVVPEPVSSETTTPPTT